MIQHHVAKLRRHHVITIHYRAVDSRSGHGVHAEDEQAAGIDLRPAIVYALERLEGAKALQAERRESDQQLETARDAAPLGEAKLLEITRRWAPGHQPRGIRSQWLKTMAKRGEPIGDERRCLAAFATKLERDHGAHRCD